MYITKYTVLVINLVISKKSHSQKEFELTGHSVMKKTRKHGFNISNLPISKAGQQAHIIAIGFVLRSENLHALVQSRPNPIPTQLERAARTRERGDPATNQSRKLILGKRITFTSVFQHFPVALRSGPRRLLGNAFRFVVFAPLCSVSKKRRSSVFGLPPIPQVLLPPSDSSPVSYSFLVLSLPSSHAVSILCTESVK